MASRAGELHRAAIGEYCSALLWGGWMGRILRDGTGGTTNKNVLSNSGEGGQGMMRDRFYEISSLQTNEVYLDVNHHCAALWK